MNLDQTIDRCHEAWREFLKGNPEPAKAMFSQTDDVTLANPFGPALHGWSRVSEMLDYASSQFKEGDSTGFETIGKYVAADLATHHEVENYRVRFAGGPMTDFALRVTSTYRREGDAWKIVLRHADPIRNFDSQGPLRKSV